MSREVRITIDDDEVFERMKRRKRELDLSWEDVLHRGLRQDAGEFGMPGEGPHRPPHGPEHGFSPPGPDSGEAGRDAGRDARHRRGDDYDDQWDRFADSVEAQVQNKVYNALRNTFGAAGIDVPEPPDPPESRSLDREVQDLSSAEDAVLAFDFLADDPRYQVPLRVNLQTSTDGLTVDVVAVREGKNVRDMNRFDPETRLDVTKRLATGTPAVLRFDDGVEGYEVEPVLRWERDDDGRPTVTAVEIEGVRLTDDEPGEPTGEDDAE